MSVEVEFIGGPWCGRVQEMEDAPPTYRVAMQTTVLATAPVTAPIMKHYVYRLCKRRRDGMICYWYVGISA